MPRDDFMAVLEEVEEPQLDDTLSNFYEKFFHAMKECYDEKLFCDVNLWARESEDSLALKKVPCHAIVLCSIAPGLKPLLLEQENDEKLLYFPDIPYSTLLNFVEDVYDTLCTSERVVDIRIDQDLATTMGMLDGGYKVEKEPEKVKAPKEDVVEILVDHAAGSGIDAGSGSIQQQFEFVLPDDVGEQEAAQEETYIIESVPHQATLKHTPTPSKKSLGPKSGRKRAAAGEAWGPLAKIVVTDRDAEERHWRKNVYNLSLGKKPSPSLEELRSNVNENRGSFVAHTSSYYTSASITNKRGNNLVAGDGNERQFRMKLPEKSICAFLAVGCRHERNIACTLASVDPSWPSESSFSNLIEATKRIEGISFGEIIKHPRCSDTGDVKERYSKAAVNAVKKSLKGLGDKEHKAKLEAAVAELKSYNDACQKLQFQHLPGKKTLLEFHLVADMQPEEVLDYCILHGGDAPDDLVIQSFFNFAVQKLNKAKLITAMCDTIACFLKLGNDNPLSKHPLVADAYNKYAHKTIEIMALQDLLSQEGRNKCKDLIEITDANYMPAATEETVTDVVVVDGKIVMTPTITKTIQLPPAKRGPKKKPPKELPCPFSDCKKVFAKEILLQGHIERMHSSSAEEKLCTADPDCNKILKSSQSLRDHVYYHHTPKTCDICDLQFPGAYKYYYHRNQEHATSLFCDICGDEFKTKEKLRVHKINKHLADDQKPYVCSICGKGYAHKTKLESHQMNVHIRSRPYKCRVENCDADFNELANRNAHERNVHQVSFKKA